MFINISDRNNVYTKYNSDILLSESFVCVTLISKKGYCVTYTIDENYKICNFYQFLF